MAGTGGRLKTVGLDDVLSVLADRTRLRLLSLMLEKEICVCYLVEALELPQPTVSRHLAYLRDSGVVDVRREGRWMHYRVASLPSAFLRVVEAAVEAFRKEPQWQHDRERMRCACCSEELVAIAPRPRSL